MSVRRCVLGRIGNRAGSIAGRKAVWMKRLRRVGDRIGIGIVVQRLLVRRQIRIDEAGEPLSHDLRRFLLLLDLCSFRAFDLFAGGQVLLLLGAEAWLGRDGRLE